jgi:hypothetical protein
MSQTLEGPGRFSRNTQYPLQVATSFSNQGSRNTQMSILPKISQTVKNGQPLQSPQNAMSRKPTLMAGTHIANVKH